jgi:hypothetical protein
MRRACLLRRVWCEGMEAQLRGSSLFKSKHSLRLQLAKSDQSKPEEPVGIRITGQTNEI